MKYVQASPAARLIGWALLLVGICAGCAPAPDASSPAASSPSAPSPKNVIIMVSDGAGFNTWIFDVTTSAP